MIHFSRAQTPSATNYNTSLPPSTVCQPSLSTPHGQYQSPTRGISNINKKTSTKYSKTIKTKGSVRGAYDGSRRHQGKTKASAARSIRKHPCMLHHLPAPSSPNYPMHPLVAVSVVCMIHHDYKHPASAPAAKSNRTPSIYCFVHSRSISMIYVVLYPADWWVGINSARPSYPSTDMFRSVHARLSRLSGCLYIENKISFLYMTPTDDPVDSR